MGRHWTFGQKIGAGFAMTVLLAILIGVVGVAALRSTVSSKDRVIDVDARRLIDAAELQAASERKASSSRGFLLTAGDDHLVQAREARTQFTTLVEKLRSDALTSEGRSLVDRIDSLEQEHQQALEAVIALRRTSATPEAIAAAFDRQVLPKRVQLDTAIEAYVSRGERMLLEGERASTDAAARAESIVIVIGLAVVASAMFIAVYLSRGLGSQIGSAVGQVQSSSTELQAAANQQATGARQQATAMNEISTTISELLATSRQIAEGAQRVARIAEQTASGARSGEGTVGVANDSVNAIRRQVDQIVNHMLELGRKSQQIGNVLDIVSELAEQTNILAINATIEAAGAGESGRRFAVVADEIRKLADRVGGSTREIRTLIEDVRAAVNTTVMATETGSKAVHASVKQFGEVTASFRQIGDLVITTTEAAREIELSTKQQTTAVEQVNIAIANVAQATKETEVSSGQTLQTASQLATLSRDLLRLVRPQVAA
jgi:CHASE3 domain sensor protein